LEIATGYRNMCPDWKKEKIYRKIWKNNNQNMKKGE